MYACQSYSFPVTVQKTNKHIYIFYCHLMQLDSFKCYTQGHGADSPFKKKRGYAVMSLKKLKKSMFVDLTQIRNKKTKTKKILSGQNFAVGGSCFPVSCLFLNRCIQKESTPTGQEGAVLFHKWGNWRTSNFYFCFYWSLFATVWFCFFFKNHPIEGK